MKKTRKRGPVTNEDLARQIGGLSQTVGGLTQTVDGLTQTVDGLAQTVDNLATATARGFAEVQKSADDRFKLIIDRFERIEANVGDMKRTLSPMVQMMAMNDRETDGLKLRLNRVERKVGIED